MIAEAMVFLRDVLTQRLNLPNQVNLDTAAKLAQQGAQGVTISLVNVEEEAALRNLPVTERRQGQLVKVEPPVHLNLYLLFAFDFANYETALVRLGQTVELFQEHRWFGPETQGGPVAVAFPARIERIVVELQGMNFEALNNLWGILGGSYFPSVVYKLRVLRIQAEAAGPAPEIEEVKVTSTLKPFVAPAAVPRRQRR